MAASEPVGWVEPLRNPSPLGPSPPAAIGVVLFAASGPIFGDAEPHHAVKGRIRPVLHAGHEAVLHLIEMECGFRSGSIHDGFPARSDMRPIWALNPSYSFYYWKKCKGLTASALVLNTFLHGEL